MMDYIHQCEASNIICSRAHQTSLGGDAADLGSLNTSLFFLHFQNDLKLKVMLDQHGHFGNNSPALICALMKEL